MVKVKGRMHVSNYNRELMRLFSNAQRSGLWTMTDKQLRFIILQMFLSWGGKYGRPTWPGISETMWGKPRYGTDGQQHGVYTPRSIPLMASEDYMKSFKTLSATPRDFEWGSDLKTEVTDGDGNKVLLANLMPYAGWKEKTHGPLRKYTPRYVMPDPLSREFNDELQEVHRQYVAKVLMQAQFNAKMEEVGVTNIMRNEEMDRLGLPKGDDDL